MSVGVKRFLPRSLFGRALMIIVTPLVLLQIIATYIFFDQHWSTLSRRLALSVAGDIAFVIELFNRLPEPADRDASMVNALHATGVLFRFEPGAILPRSAGAAGRTSDGQGVILGNSVVGEFLARALEDRVRRPYRIDDDSDDRSILIAVQLSDGVLTATVSRKRLFSATTYVFILWMVGSSLILFAVAATFMRNQVRPIQRLADAAERFGKGLDLPPFKPEGATEVRRAALEFNRMRERITRQIQQRTEMLAGVSHDLRTPLTRLKLALAMMPETEDIQDARSDVVEMERMLEAYLAFARGEGSEAARDTDITALVEEVAQNARRQGTRVTVDLPEDLHLTVRPNALKRAITNLVSNACRHGHRVHLSGAVGPRGFELDIDDDGPGIPDDKLEEVFRPFRRLDSARTSGHGGVGLGLTIARDLVRGHGGDVVLARSPLGGLRAQITLPG